MVKNESKVRQVRTLLPKSCSGIQGLDEITGGVCRKDGPRSYAGVQEAARQLSNLN
jgi:hypothetical protein